MLEPSGVSPSYLITPTGILAARSGRLKTENSRTQQKWRRHGLIYFSRIFLVFGHAKTELRGEVAVVPLLSSTETRRDRSATQFDALYTNRRWKTRAKLKAARYFSICCSELSSVTHAVLSFHRRGTDEEKPLRTCNSQFCENQKSHLTSRRPPPLLDQVKFLSSRTGQRSSYKAGAARARRQDCACDERIAVGTSHFAIKWQE